MLISMILLKTVNIEYRDMALFPKDQKRQVGRYDQSGAAGIFLVAFLLPLLFILFSIGFDLSFLLSKQEKLQALADKSVVAGAAMMPYPSIAASSAQDALMSEKGVASLSLDSQFNQSAGEVSVSQLVPLTFPTYFIPSMNFNLSAVSRAVVNPRDVFIFFDNSSYMAPPPSASNSGSWGLVDGEWPIPEFFEDVSLPLFVPPAGTTPLDPRNAGQQCFNPVLSSYKELAIRIYDWASSFPLNAVGVFTGVGATDQITMLRDIELEESSETRVQFDYFREVYARDEYCLAASEYESSHSGYLAPQRSPQLYDHGINHLDSSADLIDSTYTLPASEADNVSIRKAIWSKAVSDSDVNFIQLLQRMKVALFGSPSLSQRAAFGGEVSSSAFLLLGDFPRLGGSYYGTQPVLVENAITQKLLEIATEATNYERHLNIYITVTPHPGTFPGLNCSVTDDSGGQGLSGCTDFIDLADSFRAYIENLPQNGVWQRLKVLFIHNPDVASLANDLAAQLPLFDKSVLLVGDA